MDPQPCYGLSALFPTTHSVRKFSVLNVEVTSRVVGSDVKSHTMKLRG